MAIEEQAARVSAGTGRSEAKSRRRRPWVRPLRATITALIALVIWEVAARYVFPSYVGRPTGILAAIPTVVVKGLPSQGLETQPSFGATLWITYAAILEGTVLGTVAGAIVGLLMGRVKQVRWFLSLYVRGLYAMPLIALVPIITLWLGYNWKTRLVVVFIAVFLPITVATCDGTRATPGELVDVGRMFGARPWHIWFGISLRSAVPHIMAGLQLGINRAVTNCVAVEVLANVAGLGLSTFALSAEFKEDDAYVYVIALMLFAVLARALIIGLRRVVAPWYESSGTS